MSDQDQILQTIKQLEEQLAQLKQSVNTPAPAQPAPAPTPQPPADLIPPQQPLAPVAPAPAPQPMQPEVALSTPSNTPVSQENIVVGKEGTFDGVFMISDDEKKYQVPPNYISKSQLVIGDRLKIVEMDETGSRYSFKQLTHVARKDLEGILTKKDNQWAVHTAEGTYYVVAAAVKFFGGEIGDKAVITLPDEEVHFPVVWAAFKELVKQEERTGLIKPTPTPPKNYFKPVTPPATTTDILAKSQHDPVVPPHVPVAPPVPVSAPALAPTPTPVPVSMAQPTPQPNPVPVVPPQFDQTVPVSQSTPPPPQPAAPSVTEGEVHVSAEDDMATSGEVDLTITDEQRWELR